MARAVSQTNRILTIYDLLAAGGTVRKTELAGRFGVDQRSIQRDIDTLRGFLAERTMEGADLWEIVYDRREKGFRLRTAHPRLLTNGEILAVCKVLLESRSMVKAEMLPLLDKLVDRCVPEENKKAVSRLIANEKHHYIPPRHGKELLPDLWELGQAVQEHRVMEICYTRLDGRTVDRQIEPVGLMFSEYYFYLTAFLRNVDRAEEFSNKDDLFPTIYRIDRIRSFRVLDEHFRVPYSDRFEEGEFRKRVQFMYGGRLERIRFKYTGPSIEAVLDRLPTAEIVSRDEVGWTIQAEVFGTGVDMWLRSQGDYVSVIKEEQHG